MIQLLILFFAVVFIIAIIMLYKKYIRIKNVVDEELDKKYNKVKKAIGSNNTQISQLKKNADELINTPSNDTNTLEDKVNNNKKQIAENRAVMVDKNFQEINKIFKYENGFVTGGNAGQLKIGSDNIQLNVPNPVQVRVCDEQHCDDSDIFTKSNVNDNLALVNDENVGGGVDESKNDNIDDNIVYSVNANGEKDNNLEFNNDTKELSANNVKIVMKRTDNWPEEYLKEADIKIQRTPTINKELLPKQTANLPMYVNEQGVSGVIATFSSHLLKFEVQNGEIGIAFSNDDEIVYLINISNGEVTSITSSITSA